MSSFDCVLKQFEEHRTIGYTRHLVVRRQVFHSRLRLFTRGDVLHDRDVVERRAIVVALQSDGDAHPDEVAILVPVALLGGE